MTDTTLSEQARALADAHKDVWFVPFDVMVPLLRALAKENDRLRADKARLVTLYRLSAPEEHDGAGIVWNAIACRYEVVSFTKDGSCVLGAGNTADEAIDHAGTYLAGVYDDDEETGS